MLATRSLVSGVLILHSVIFNRAESQEYLSFSTSDEFIEYVEKGYFYVRVTSFKDPSYQRFGEVKGTYPKASFAGPRNRVVITTFTKDLRDEQHIEFEIHDIKPGAGSGATGQWVRGDDWDYMGEFAFFEFAPSGFKGNIHQKNESSKRIEFSKSKFDGNLAQDKEKDKEKEESQKRAVFARVSGFKERWNAVHRWSRKNGFATAYPDFEKSENEDGWIKIGFVAIRNEAVDHFDVPQGELEKFAEDVGDPTQLIRAAHRWAREKDKDKYVTGLPSFEHSSNDNGRVYGVFAVKKDAAHLERVSRDELTKFTDEPSESEQRIRAFHRWARNTKKGNSAWPTFEQSKSNGVRFYGAAVPNSDYIRVISLSVETFR